MNERIKELAKQANIHFSRIGILDGDPDGTARLVGYSKMEKFAELIVRECANICRDRKMTPSAFTADELLEHFGVEE